MTEIKSQKLLEDFFAYCTENPHLRFWQALANWSGMNMIQATDTEFRTRDTYYWETKDGK